MTYERRSVEEAIVLALREMGGSGSRKEIRRLIADMVMTALRKKMFTVR